MNKWVRCVLVILIIAGCKKAFTPSGALSSTNKYLVIDGIINSGADSTFIKLSRTKKFDALITVAHETGAQVTIESDATTTYPLTEITPGTYSAAPLNLDNSHKYRLRIKTAENEEYLSDFVAVKNAPPVDSVGFASKADGMHLYVNTHDATNNTRYYRWEYKEAWKFHSLYHSVTNPLDDHYYCYAKDTSSSILIGSSTKLSSDVIFQEPVATIPVTSDKIQIRYSILIKQYALTADAYSFWDNLNKNTTQLGGIFDMQPSINQTNYHNVNNPAEIVVGYLSVGATSSKRVFINAGQLAFGYQLNNPYGCKIDTEFYWKVPQYWQPQAGYPNIFGPGYLTIAATYGTPVPPFGLPIYYTYSTSLCVDCTVRGSETAPPFWQQ